MAVAKSIDSYRSFRLAIVVMLAVAALTAAACTLKKPRTMASPRGYNLNAPDVLKLPLELDEISGLAYNAKDTSILAINDERGYLYKIYPRQPKRFERWQFAVSADYEDLVVLPPYFFVLKSSGALTVFRFLGTVDSLQSFDVAPPEQGGNEFEAMWWDPRLQRILVLCKECRADKKDSSTVFALDPRTSAWSIAPFGVNAEEIAVLLNKTDIRFKPSAAALHPITGELYIISAVNKVLVVASRKGNVKNAYPLDAGFFKQPEGIAFAPDGTLYISNEAADVGVADVLVYPYKIAITPTPR